jgi:hypothetical protein
MEPTRDDPADDLRPEYDLTQLRGGVRGKYARKMAHGDGYEQTAGGVSTNGTGKLGREEIRAFLDRVWQELKPRFNQCITPLGFARGGELGVFGTGTLFRVADLSLLVTASHVFERAKEEGRELAICDARQGAMAVPLVGRVSGHTAYDVAVFELAPETVAEIPNRSFMSVHQADRRNRRPARGTYCVCGFPEALAGVEGAPTKLTAIPHTEFATLYMGDTDSLLNYEPAFHILLDTPRGDGERLDTSPLPVPDRLHGMSGCSVWQVYYEGLSTKHWTPDDAVVVGVQTGVYRKGNIIKATRWHVVDQVIRHAYPELAGPLDLHIPMSGT